MAPSPYTAAALALDPSLILRAQGIVPDSWQRQVLFTDSQSTQLLCCRGAGKSRVTSAKALHRALFHPGSLVLLISRSQRQSAELFRYVKEGYAALNRPIAAVKETETQLELTNRSRIVCLPGKEETIRSYQGVALLIKDEAARIPDDLNKSVTPMLAVSKGQEIDLSTPWGQRGWFWKKWTDREAAVKRFKVTWRECPRHTEEFIRKDQGLRSAPPLAIDVRPVGAKAGVDRRGTVAGTFPRPLRRRSPSAITAGVHVGLTPRRSPRRNHVGLTP